MTKAERDAIVIRTMDEYKATLEEIACLSTYIRNASHKLAEINKNLYSQQNEDLLVERLQETDSDTLTCVPQYVDELKVKLARKQELIEDLRGFGYGEFVRDG